MRRLSLEQTTLWMLLALLFAIAIRVPVDTDTWWHLRSGEHTLSQGMIYADPFSHTFQGKAWINHSWGAQLVLVAVYRWAGDAGLALYTAVCALVGMMLLYGVSSGNSYLRGFVLILASATAAVFWSARPQMLSFVLSAAFIFVLYRARAGKLGWLWSLPILMALWGNLHAGHAIGFLFMLAFGVGEWLNSLLGTRAENTPQGFVGRVVLVFGLCGAALLISPYGLQNALVPFQTVSMGALRDFIQEWNSPNFQGRETWAFIAMLVLLLFAGWTSKARFDWTSFLLVGGSLFLALMYGRNIAMFAVAVTPVLSALLDEGLRVRGFVLRPSRPSAFQARINLLLLALVYVGVGVYALSVLLPTTIKPLQAKTLPVKAVAYLNAQGAPPNLFNSYNWGGYLLQFAPEYPVFIDGRTDLYGEFLRVYLDTALARGDWRGVLAQYAIGTVLIETGSGLDVALASEAGWRESYRDALAVMYVRETNP